MFCIAVVLALWLVVSVPCALLFGALIREMGQHTHPIEKSSSGSRTGRK